MKSTARLPHQPGSSSKLQSLFALPARSATTTTLAAGATAFALVQGANAQIAHFETTIIGDYSGVLWDIDSSNANGNEFRFAAYSSRTSGVYLYGISNAARFVDNMGGGKIQNLALSALVNSALNFDTDASAIYTNGFRDATGFTLESGYMGFRFTPDATTLYGWARVTLSTGGATITVHEWAYDTTGAAISVGATSAVPEPAAATTGLGLLALGAAGLRRQRWLKRKAA